MRYPPTEFTGKDQRTQRILEARDRGPKIKRIKRQEAEKRNKEWQKKSAKEQLNYLDKLFGKNKGASKQRKKLQNENN